VAIETDTYDPRLGTLWRDAVHDLLCSRSLQTIKDAYSHIETEERAEHVSDILDCEE
jgi:hypothetical protein